MKHKYYELTASADYLSFTFESFSLGRTVVKRVEFIEVGDRLYNLAFGDVNEQDELDDLVVTNNNDTAQVLATVIRTVLIFFDKYPGNAIFFKGSTLARTRLYQIILSRELRNWNDNFTVLRVRDGQIFPFETGTQAEGFVIKLKNT